MHKVIFTFVIGLLTYSVGHAQAWDRQMQVKKMSIHVKSDAFTATTFIEMEFYNPGDTEIEGLYQFTLDTGQAITAFQLDLFGKYRDGSIEEKWKATNAYNTIVGKRVDPALLTMSYNNHYSLRIYPVPAKSSRKVTMTIQQLLKIEKDKAVYKLPLDIREVVEEMNIQVYVKGSSGFPSVIRGLLENEVFSTAGSDYSLSKIRRSMKADKPVSFSIPMSMQQHSLCIKQLDDRSAFALRLKPAINRTYTIQPRRVTVFWDVSNSGNRRNIQREIGFLKQYVADNKIAQLNIISFNQHLKDTAVFHTDNNVSSPWVEYLHSFTYEGATQFGLLDFSKTDADVILLFTDGKNSVGTSLPVQGTTHVYCINSASYPDPQHIDRMIGRSGGRYINLSNLSFGEALEKARTAENVLLAIKADSADLVLDQDIGTLRDEMLLLTGIIPANAKRITFSYGNNGNTREVEHIAVSNDDVCNGSGIDRIQMLTLFDGHIRHPNWYTTLDFGKKEGVVTPYTAYIVLEKLDDYIKYKITPPKELQSQCDMNIFVEADHWRRQQYKNAGELEILTAVAQSYNERIALSGREQPLIAITKENAGERFENEKSALASTGGPSNGLTGKVSGLPVQYDQEDKTLTEVVVTALGQTRQSKELGYAVSKVRAAELTLGKAVNLQNGLTGKVSGLNVSTINSGVFGDTRITLRGIRSLTGDNQPMLVLDGVPIALSYLNAINPNDITEVTVLKSASATAIYGPEGVNGALIITTKKGSKAGYGYSYYWGTYRLKDRQDVDYLRELKNASRSDKLSDYYQLKKIHGDGAGFYFDAAQHLFETGYRRQAIDILFSAAEITGGEKGVLRAMGYMLESWKEFGEAIKIYYQLLLVEKNDLQSYRDLALAYYQDKKYQEAVETFYQGILKTGDEYEIFYSKKTRAMMLQEMNAIIAVHKDVLDLSGIHKQLVKPLEVDMRIVLDCNDRYLGYRSLSVDEPGGTTSSAWINKSNGRILSDGQYYQNERQQEYQVSDAKPGKYRIKVVYYDRNYSYRNNEMSNPMRIPAMIRVTTFRNFGTEKQSIGIENVIMDNQQGNVEIAEVKWEGK